MVVVLLTGGGTTAVDSRVVVVVEVAGSFTTVVHEVNSMAIAGRTGIRMINFFIVGGLFPRTIRRKQLPQMYYRRIFSR